MAFKKIDEAAATGGASPLDAFLLQGTQKNTKAAYEGRPRRAATAYHADLCPVWGSCRLLAVPLGVWPLSARCSQLTVRVMGSCVTADVNLGLAILTGSGLSSRDTPTVFAVGDAQKSLTLDVSGRAGLQQIYLLIRSELKAGAATKALYLAGTDVRPYQQWWDLQAPVPFTLTLGRRYQIAYAEHSGTPGPPGPDGWPGPFDVLDWDEDGVEGDPDQWIMVWPGQRLANPSTQRNAFSLDLHELGALTVTGISVAETAYLSQLDLAQALEPGYPSSARSVGAVYQRQRALWTSRTPIHHLGGCYDPGNLDNNLNTPRQTAPTSALVILGSTWRKVGAVYLGNSNDEAAVIEGVTQYRRTYQIAALLCAAWQPQQVGTATVELRATLYTFDAGAGTWSADAVQETIWTGPVLLLPSPGPPQDDDAASLGSLVGHSGPASGGSFVALMSQCWHTLRGALPAEELHRLPSAVTVAQGQLTDTSPNVQRKLILEARVESGRSDAGVRLVAYDCLWVPSITVWSTEEVV